MTNNASQKKIKDIKLLVSDVDGVLTDGTIYIGSDGTEFKNFSVEDGAGAAYARMAGLPIALISGRFSLCTLLRSKEMGIKHCYQGNLNKLEAYGELLSMYRLSDKQVAYIGDGLIDIPVMLKSGFSVSPQNAHQSVKDIADYITEKSGGEGVLREVVELILKEQEIYNDVLEKMKKKINKT